MAKTNPIQIKKLIKEHLTDVKSILDSQFGINYISTEQLLENILCEKSLCLVAIKDNEVLGVSIAKMGTAKNLSECVLAEKEWFINEFTHYKKIALRKQMAIKIGFEGKGIGSLLINESIRILSQSCDIILTIVWEKEHDEIMKRIMTKNNFKSFMSIPNYWQKDSIKKQYICPICQIIPCTCSANIYGKKMSTSK